MSDARTPLEWLFDTLYCRTLCRNCGRITTGDFCGPCVRAIIRAEEAGWFTHEGGWFNSRLHAALFDMPF